MVWLRDPVGQQPAGSEQLSGVTVANVPGKWDIWTGTVNNAPIINWVKPEGEDISELEFDVLDFINDAKQRGLDVPGTYINAVAVGFEIWKGPITNLKSEDFYIQMQ
jgi:Glycosyl hydrolase family 12